MANYHGRKSLDLGLLEIETKQNQLIAIKTNGTIGNARMSE